MHRIDISASRRLALLTKTGRTHFPPCLCCLVRFKGLILLQIDGSFVMLEAKLVVFTFHFYVNKTFCWQTKGQMCWLVTWSGESWWHMLHLEGPLSKTPTCFSNSYSVAISRRLQAQMCASCTCPKLWKGKKHQNEISLCVFLCPRWRQRKGCRSRGGGRMECSWKTVLLLVCASLGVQYTAIRTLRDSLSGPCQGASHCHTRHYRGTRTGLPHIRRGLTARERADVRIQCKK